MKFSICLAALLLMATCAMAQQESPIGIDRCAPDFEQACLLAAALNVWNAQFESFDKETGGVDPYTHPAANFLPIIAHRATQAELSELAEEAFASAIASDRHAQVFDRQIQLGHHSEALQTHRLARETVRNVWAPTSDYCLVERSVAAPTRCRNWRATTNRTLETMIIQTEQIGAGQAHEQSLELLALTVREQIEQGEIETRSEAQTLAEQLRVLSGAGYDAEVSEAIDLMIEQSTAAYSTTRFTERPDLPPLDLLEHILNGEPQIASQQQIDIALAAIVDHFHQAVAERATIGGTQRYSRANKRHYSSIAMRMLVLNQPYNFLEQGVPRRVTSNAEADYCLRNLSASCLWALVEYMYVIYDADGSRRVGVHLDIDSYRMIEFLVAQGDTELANEMREALIRRFARIYTRDIDEPYELPLDFLQPFIALGDDALISDIFDSTIDILTENGVSHSNHTRVLQLILELLKRDDPRAQQIVELEADFFEANFTPTNIGDDKMVWIHRLVLLRPLLNANLRDEAMRIARYEHAVFPTEAYALLPEEGGERFISRTPVRSQINSLLSIANFYTRVGERELALEVIDNAQYVVREALSQPNTLTLDRQTYLEVAVLVARASVDAPIGEPLDIFHSWNYWHRWPKLYESVSPIPDF